MASDNDKVAETSAPETIEQELKIEVVKEANDKRAEPEQTVKDDKPPLELTNDEDKTTELEKEIDSGQISLESTTEKQTSEASLDNRANGSLKASNQKQPKRHVDLERIHSICMKLSEKETFQDDGKISLPDDSILQVLVSEDMSSIKSTIVLKALFVEYLHLLPPKVISEVLSVLIAIVKKSVFHLESARGLLIPCIDHLLSETNRDQVRKVETLPDSPSSASCVSLTKHFLREWINLLIAHSCDVEELKAIIRYSELDPSLLNFIQQANLRQRNRPLAFFAFPGTKGSMMSLPPFQKWPIQTGWSFSTWFFLEPKACAQPYLYNFKTGKSGLGYSAHFTGNCLVLTSIRVKGKGVQHCVAYEFPSYKWIHCAITYHNKWRASEIKVYVNGQLSANIEMHWQVQTSEIFDKCFIGGSGSITSNDRSGELNSFCGQMSALYLFNEGLSPAQICAIHRLGPSYMGQFKYSNESHVNLPPSVSKVLYDEKLASTLFCLFTPVAVDSGTLCIQLAPFKSSTSASAQNYFISAPHAALLSQTKAITTQSICSTLQSLGCTRSLLPLLEVYASKGDSEASSSLIGFLCDLLESSPHWFANEIVQNNGFVMIACALTLNSKTLISEKLLDIFINLTRTLLSTSSTVGDTFLLKHLMDNILFNPNLWVYSDPKLQIRLYSYLANEFLHGTKHTTKKYTISNSSSNSSPFVPYNPTSSAVTALTNQNYSTEDATKTGFYEPPVTATDFFGEIRRVSTVLQSLHALKYFYWMVEEANCKKRNLKLRPNKSELTIIRSHILLFTKELIVRAENAPLDEIQGLLNYLSSCKQPENLLDVLELLSCLLKEHPVTIVSALHQKQGIKVLFTLISSKVESVRIQALRLLSLFLAQCTHRKKQDIMSSNNLFTLLFDKLRVYKPLTLETYESLIHLMLESEVPHNSGLRDISKQRIENSIVVKVIATLLHEERTHNVESDINVDIRKLFINDLWNLIVNSKENRRIILQMSVWQHWLVNVIDSTIADSQLVRDQVLSIFRVLLYHAIRYEFGGWRVWIDTLAIIHTKVSYDEFCLRVNNDSACDTTKSSVASRSFESHKDNLVHKTETKIEVSSEVKKQNNLDESKGEAGKEEIQQHIVSSISERITNESSGLQMDDEVEKGVDEPDTKQIAKEMQEVELKDDTSDKHNESIDSVDLAPSRAYRKLSLQNIPEEEASPPPTGVSSPGGGAQSSASGVEITRQPSLTSSHLDEPLAYADEGSIEDKLTKETKADEINEEEDADEERQNQQVGELQAESGQNKATASPAFRIPEFKWGNILIKLLNDLMFSIECDLYHWRCIAKCTNLDTAPFVPKSAGSAGGGGGQSTGGGNSSTSNSRSSSVQASSTAQIEILLQKPENQIYIINVIHFVSQLADNIIIAAGGLLPLLADATGGNRSTSTNLDTSKLSATCEGLSMPQANSLLYRLINMVDIVIFAASHINLAELETDKNTTCGGILRQCLRLACTVTVKNCLVVRSLSNKIASMGIGGQFVVTLNDFPKEMFDSYQGCSLLSANGLFENSALSLDSSDLIANVEYSPHQTPNTSAMPSLLPFQSSPIRDPNKLLQTIDISRIQACIYHDFSTESRQSQFIALSSLYFISVLMVSKYRDIIEPKQKTQRKSSTSFGSGQQSPDPQQPTTTTGFQNGSSISNIEANLLSFGRIQLNDTQSTAQASSNSNALTDMLTTKLENTLDTVCPLLKSIMCDFSAFLSKTLIGSHGQDLVNKETDRTFKRSNTSPVELVMLLCSQEWQNTLQKNAGLAFIELINEGRVLSHGMKDHIVRVAMEAEFIMSRLRADDVAKHEHFNQACAETLSARLHEEVLINSLITSAARRDYMIYCKFKDVVQRQRRRNYKLDIWEDDDRRRRRFVIDSWDDSTQNLFSSSSSKKAEGEPNAYGTETKRILELQQTIELGGIDNHCSPSGTDNQKSTEGQSDTNGVHHDKDEDYDDEDFEDDEHVQNDSNSPDSELDSGKQRHKLDGEEDEKRSKDRKNLTSSSGLKQLTDEIENELKMAGHQIWEYDDCGSVNDFTGSVVFAAECSLIWNIYAIPGIIQVTAQELYFEPNQNIIEYIDSLKRGDKDGEQREEICHQSGSFMDSSPALRKIDLRVLRYCDFLTCHGKVLLSDIRAIFSRHYLLQPHALEIFLAQRTSVMFAFADFETVKRAVKYLPPVGVGIKYGIPQSRRASLMAPRQLFAASNMTQKWQSREIGNFQYLMFLNTIAGRTYQDLNQYPVFPWILTNYESDQLDLNLPSNFRDLSKPVGALNNKRRNEFIERYLSWDNPKVPAFHYGTHYSTAAFTLNWLCRLRGACNSAHLALQDGKYEEDSRLFLSIGDSWVSSLTGGQQNVKELIPEFFYLPEMFHSNLNLPEVEYPPWAKSAEQFVRMHRLALESELVSCQLHQWIDLIFGYKQRGPEAINAVNTFYYLTYQGNVNLNMIQDPSLKEAIETQIKHFGQTPSQLTTEPHQPRFSALHVSPSIFSSSVDEVNKVVKFPFKTAVLHISPCINNYIVANLSQGTGDGSSTGTLPNPNNANSPSSVLTITSNNQYQIHKWSPNDQSGHPLVIDPQLEQPSSARRQLVDVDDLCSGISLKVYNQSVVDLDVPSEVRWPCAHYIVTLDGRYIIMGSFYDNSFRVFTTEGGKLCQVIYGHRAPITCIARSDGNTSADFYVATGSQDCSLLLWNWNEKYAQIEGNGVSAVHNPLPKLTISGHQTPVLSVVICSELGLIVSGSKNLILVNTTTTGENLLEIDVILPNILDKTFFEHRTQSMSECNIQRPQVKDKQKTILEASMLGESGHNYGSSHKTIETAAAIDSRSQSSLSNTSDRFLHLKDLCQSDYYITSLQMARELAFIVCIALPPPKRRSRSTSAGQLVGEPSRATSSAALLMTFNLKGQLMDSTTIGQSLNGPRFGDTCILQTTRDGEHLILNDSPTSLKIYRTFDLQPVYAYNTTDLPSTLDQDDQNRVRSLTLLDHKYILVGLENGKIIVYNADFKNFQ